MPELHAQSSRYLRRSSSRRQFIYHPVFSIQCGHNITAKYCTHKPPCTCFFCSSDRIILLTGYVFYFLKNTLSVLVHYEVYCICSRPPAHLLRFPTCFITVAPSLGYIHFAFESFLINRPPLAFLIALHHLVRCEEAEKLPSTRFNLPPRLRWMVLRLVSASASFCELSVMNVC
jgi:hypothetical protein